MTELLGFLMSDTSRLLRRAFDARARDIGVTNAQWKMLITLARNEGQNQGFIADLLEVEPITACRMVDRMEEFGLVERRRDPTDRRAWLLYLTSKSRPMIDELKACGEALFNDVLAGVSETERDQFITTIHKIRHNLGIVAETVKGAAHG